MAIVSMRPAAASSGPGQVASVAGTGTAEAQEPTPTVGSSSERVAPDPVFVIGGVVAIVVAWFVARGVGDDAYPVDVQQFAAGVGIFAVVYIWAQSLERLLEPIASLVYTTDTEVSARDLALKEAEQKQAASEKARADAERNPQSEESQAKADKARADAQTALDKAAELKAAVEKKRANRGVAFWSLASASAVLLSAWQNIYLLNLIGAPASDRGFDILATGLVIGGGTKPLHDLITRIQEAKDSAKDAGASKAAGTT
jgi:hypothetical protein